MIRFESPIFLLVALALLAGIVAFARLRRIDLRPLTRALIVCGLVLIALAAGGARVELPHRGEVAVMVDVSPSTRTAAYRQAPALQQRMRELVGSARHTVYQFAQDARPAEITSPMRDVPVDRTMYSPPPGAAAVLLFSDGHFALPEIVPPTYAVIDPKLSDARDARVQRMEVEDNLFTATIVNESAPRELSLSGNREPITVAGSHVVAQTIEAGTQPGPIVARLSPGDAWPENDALAIHPPPPEQRQQWWVGGSPPSGQWLPIAVSDLPTDAPSYLRPALIVLDNVSADSLTSAQHDRLMQYVRDLGGGLILLGGDRAFAAGAYAGTMLESLSPLASHPPEPRTRWILLADSSGSMARMESGTSRWRIAADSVTSVLRYLPEQDPVSVGSFARELRWWSRHTLAGEAAKPPSGVAPHGPTNLQAALQSIISASDDATPTELLILSDADAEVDVDALADSLRKRRIRVHLLAIAEVESDNAVRQLVERSGGTTLVQSDPKRWASSLRELLRAASPDYLGRQPLIVRFTGPLAAMGQRTVEQWNRVWPKNDATASALAAGDESFVMSAMWQVGAGRSAAVAFALNLSEMEALAAMVASPPRDPRFSVTWDAGRKLRISIDAVEADRFLNNLRLELDLFDAADPHGRRTQTHVIPQTSPGRYQLVLPAPRSPVLAAVRLEDSVLSQRALAGRYAPEFDGIGTNRAVLRELAERSGGRMIEPDDTAPIQLDWPRRRIDLSAILAAGGAIFVALGLIHWKLR